MSASQQALLAYTSAVAGYTGPGDVVSSATAWGGLRAYNNASIGTNAIRLREDGGNTESDFVTITGGGLDLTAISTFKGAHNLFVTKLYDQTGNGNDWVQATMASQPAFLLATLGSLPVMRFAANPTFLLSGSITVNQAFTNVLVLNTSADNRPMGQAGTAGVVLVGNTTPHYFSINSGLTSAETAAALNTWYSFQGLYNGSSSSITLNGTIGGSINPSTSGIAGNVCLGGDRNNGGFSWAGDVMEISRKINQLEIAFH